MPDWDLGTVDGHNREIIYDLWEPIAESEPKPLFNDVDKRRRGKGYSDKQVQLNRQGSEQRGLVDWSDSVRAISPAPLSPPQVGASNVGSDDDIPWSDLEDGEIQDGVEGIYDEESSPPFTTIPPEVLSPPQVGASNVGSDYDIPLEHGEIQDGVYVPFAYFECDRLFERISGRTCTNLPADTELLLNADYPHNVSPIPNPQDTVRSMRTPTGKSQYFSPEYDNAPENQRPIISLEDSLNGSFKLLMQDPARPGQTITLSVRLRHMTLPGSPEDAPWDGFEEEWTKAVDLSFGRFHKAATYDPDPKRALPNQHATAALAARTLGYPDSSTLAAFICRTDIKAAFRELWDESLQHISSDAKELPHNHYGRVPVTWRIFHSRRLAGHSEYDVAQPNKAGWGMNCHLARFCLQVEKICNRDGLPPIQGQIPDLAGNAAADVVTWGGIELARTLWRLKKGYCRADKVLYQAVTDVEPTG